MGNVYSPSSGCPRQVFVVFFINEGFFCCRSFLSYGVGGQSRSVGFRYAVVGFISGRRYGGYIIGFNIGMEGNKGGGGRR